MLIRLIISVLVLSSFALPSSTNAESGTVELFRKYKSSVVVVLAFDKNGLPSAIGSGFYFEDDLIATNAHVIQDASKVVLRTVGSDSSFEATEIAHVSKGLDLALLRVPRRGVPVPVSSSAGIEVGEKVVAIGNPRGLEGTVSEGIVSAIRGREDFRMLQITAPISPGSSGGPVFSDAGTVIGVATSTLLDAQNVNFAVPASYLRNLKGAGKTWEPVIEQPKRSGSSANAVMMSIAKARPHCFKYVDITLTNSLPTAVSSIRFLAVIKNRADGLPVDYIHQVVPESQFIKQQTVTYGASSPQILPARLGVPKTLEFRTDLCPSDHIVEFRILDFEVSRQTGLEKDFLTK